MGPRKSCLGQRHVRPGHLLMSRRPGGARLRRQPPRAPSCPTDETARRNGSPGHRIRQPPPHDQSTGMPRSRRSSSRSSRVLPEDAEGWEQTRPARSGRAMRPGSLSSRPPVVGDEPPKPGPTAHGNLDRQSDRTQRPGRLWPHGLATQSPSCAAASGPQSSLLATGRCVEAAADRIRQ